jgi:hypothetical protein
MASPADRANALALLLTPFVRGMMPTAPLAVVDGLQMGVGKNYFADMLAITATGAPVEPMPWSMDDEENRKVITATFRQGADIFVFDEAHHLQGGSLARALTGATWQDRQLGSSLMLDFPNHVTWVSLGNKVRVEGDIVRRVYRIALHPKGRDPQDRTSSQFKHPDLRAWTREHRREIVEALLTMVRGWFAAGQPAGAREVSFGSFEGWERIVGGILHHAGVRGFLENLTEWRSESSFETRYWQAHVEWLHADLRPGRRVHLRPGARGPDQGLAQRRPARHDRPGRRGLQGVQPEAGPGVRAARGPLVRRRPAREGRGEARPRRLMDGRPARGRGALSPLRLTPSRLRPILTGGMGETGETPAAYTHDGRK